MKDSQNINTSNSTCYLEMFNTLNEPVFIITSGNILLCLIARAITILKVSERVRASLEKPEVEFQS